MTGPYPDPSFRRSLDHLATLAQCPKALPGVDAGLVVKCGRLLQFGVSCEVVLNPKLGAGLFQERFDRRATGTRLVLIIFERWDAAERALFRKVIEVA